MPATSIYLVHAGKKLCMACRKYLPVKGKNAAFAVDKKQKSGLALECRVCRKRYYDQYRPVRLSKLYGIPLEAVTELQKIKACQICGEPFLRTIHIDHDHATGKVRGVLCMRCNTGLGMFGDKITNLQNAAAYLQKFSN